MQDDIVQEEEKLCIIDKRYEDAFFDKAIGGPVTPSRNDSLRNDPDPMRRQILRNLKPMLKEYSMTQFSRFENQKLTIKQMNASALSLR